MKIIMIIAVSLLCLLACFLLWTFVLAPRRPSVSRFEKIEIAGEDLKNGIFDPSIEYGADGTGWLAYSRVEWPEHVETHLARTTDHGETWTYAGTVNRSVDGSLVTEGKTYQGVWRYETSTLVYDSEDEPARRWKLFVQRYLSIPPYKEGNSLFANGWVEYKYAANPEGPWSDAIRLFGKRENNCQVDLNSLHPDLRENAFYNELGSLAVGGTIYLSMDASTTRSGLGEWEKRKIILVSSKDHGVTWNYVGRLTNYDDADYLGYLALTGSSLVKVGGRYFLFFTPAGAKGIFKRNRAHDGTLIAEFDDLGQARLKRDARGRMVVLMTIKPDLHSGGLSDYDEQNTAGGVLFAQINLHATSDYFQVFNTRERLVPVPWNGESRHYPGLCRPDRRRYAEAVLRNSTGTLNSLVRGLGHP